MQTQDDALVMAVVLLTSMEDSTLKSMMNDIHAALLIEDITDFQRERLENWLNIIGAEFEGERAYHD